MPHFVIDCSANIIRLKTPEEIMGAVLETAEATGLFVKGDIKVRINPFTHFTVAGLPAGQAGTNNDFIHIFGHIMQGRNTEQKADLSKKMVTRLKSMFPAVPVISMNITDFEKATYCNKSMV